MIIQAVSSFDVTGWDQTPYGDAGAGPLLSRATVGKKFAGDLVGESTAELLMCQAHKSDLSLGAGYVASERVVGTLAGHEGTFVMQHWGVSGAGGGQTTGGRVVPGSGTGDLAGLSGTVEIAVGEDGAHTLTLNYELP